ncbi:hypothetical protein, partial [Nodularia spumigena]|uniref:hypothetical protein n=1 Tax=Nodularia spumigena TaxID=70799 RepID=UPI003A91B143
MTMLYSDDTTVDNTTSKKPIWMGEKVRELGECDDASFAFSLVAGGEVRGLVLRSKDSLLMTEIGSGAFPGAGGDLVSPSENSLLITEIGSGAFPDFGGDFVSPSEKSLLITEMGSGAFPDFGGDFVSPSEKSLLI